MTAKSDMASAGGRSRGHVLQAKPSQGRAAPAPNTGAVLGFAANHQRPAALGEIHSRPYPLISAPRLLVQVAFMTEAGFAVDHAVLSDLSRAAGIAPPDTSARHLVLPSGAGTLRWERHTEFSTYLYEGPLAKDGNGFHEHPFGSGFTPPGTVISGIRLEIHKRPRDLRKFLNSFDAASLCASVVEGGAATIMTDFRQDADGLTRIAVLDGGMSAARTGALAQRLIEIETYRTLAMLGLPLAISLSGRIRKMEDRLADLTLTMRDGEGRDNAALLEQLTELAAELEADAASSAYRFGASRAYDGIVEERLEALEEHPVAGHETLTAFLQKRMAPAIRTCRSVEDRQANLSRKLTRATTLLRTWVDVELEKQNSELLTSMNSRARLQLRLQQTVEGLSVAAVAYYVVGLFGYLAKGAEGHLFGFSVSAATAMFVPVALISIWLIVRRIRQKHGEG
jgi:uncharacterized membrane-anchored protein